jgi:hypothetical protein
MVIGMSDAKLCLMGQPSAALSSARAEAGRHADLHVDGIEPHDRLVRPGNADGNPGSGQVDVMPLRQCSHGEQHAAPQGRFHQIGRRELLSLSRVRAVHGHGLVPGLLQGDAVLRRVIERMNVCHTDLL